jgi:hypothetical protein
MGGWQGDRARAGGFVLQARGQQVAQRLEAVEETRGAVGDESHAVPRHGQPVPFFAERRIRGSGSEVNRASRRAAGRGLHARRGIQRAAEQGRELFGQAGRRVVTGVHVQRRGRRDLEAFAGRRCRTQSS